MPEEEEFIPQDIEVFVKTRMDRFHEFLSILGPELATTLLDKGEIKKISKSIEEAFDVYELAYNLFKKAYEHLPEKELRELFEGEDINPFNIYVYGKYLPDNFDELDEKTKIAIIREAQKRAMEELWKTYAFRCAFNILVRPLSEAYLYKSYKGFIPKLSRTSIEISKELSEEEERRVSGGRRWHL